MRATTEALKNLVKTNGRTTLANILNNANCVNIKRGTPHIFSITIAILRAISKIVHIHAKPNTITIQNIITTIPIIDWNVKFVKIRKTFPNTIGI